MTMMMMMIRTSDVRASNQGRVRSHEPELQTEIKEAEYIFRQTERRRFKIQNHYDGRKSTP